MANLKVIGLDLSLLSTGVCILSGDSEGKPNVTTDRIIRESTSGVAASVDRLMSISDEIIGLVYSVNPDVVIIEAVAMNQVWQAAAIGELHGVVKTDLRRKTGRFPMVEQATKMRKEIIGKLGGKFESVTVKSKGKERQTRKISYGMVPGKKGKMRRATVKDVIESRFREQGLCFPSQDEMDAYVAARFAWNSICKGATMSENEKKPEPKKDEFCPCENSQVMLTEEKNSTPRCVCCGKQVSKTPVKR